MKQKAMALGMALCLCLGMSTAMTETSVLRSGGTVAVYFEQLEGTEIQAFELVQGDKFFVFTALTEGSASVVIKRDNGDVIYEGSGMADGSFILEIQADGIYRVAIEGEGASGSFLLLPAGDGQTAESTMPALRQLVRGAAYTMVYEPEIFEHTYDAAEDTSLFVPTGEVALQSRVAALSVTTVNEPMDEIAAQMLAQEGAQELEASLIDWHAARHIRMQDGSGQAGGVQDTYIIEMRADASLVCKMTYFEGEEGTAAEMQNIIHSIVFTK